VLLFGVAFTGKILNVVVDVQPMTAAQAAQERNIRKKADITRAISN
jgi:hypothetical protein